MEGNKTLHGLRDADSITADKTAGKEEAKESVPKQGLLPMIPQNVDELKPKVPPDSTKEHATVPRTTAVDPITLTAPDPITLAENPSALLATDEGDRDTLDEPPKQPLNLEADGRIPIDAATESTQKAPASGTDTSLVDQLAMNPKSAEQVKPGISGKPSTSAISQSPPIPQAGTSTEAASQRSVAASALPPGVPSSVLEVGIPQNTGEIVPPTRLPEDDAIDLARDPLTKLYGKYICKTNDTSLADARKRLKRAIEQTRVLRQSFTERVYTKYRVCLKPPKETEQIISEIQQDPAKAFRELSEVTEAVKEEKEIERQEAVKLNAEITQTAMIDRTPLLPNVDNAEQLMLLTSGLDLVILPEDKLDSDLLSRYTERGPTDVATGQRARNISQASAIAAEVILDRTRKASAMRVERQRRRQLQLLRGENVTDGQTDATFSSLQLLSSTESKPPTEKPKTAPTQPVQKMNQPQYQRPAPKGGRSKAHSSAASGALLNLNPTADEVKPTGKPKAATAAMITRGVGPCAIKSVQLRLRHPHPESLGGLRRANISTPAVRKDVPGPATTPVAEAHVANTLPPLPTTKDRLERKPLPIVHSNLSRSRASVRRVVSHFVGEPGNPVDVPKLHFLNQVRKLDPGERIGSQCEVKRDNKGTDDDVASVLPDVPSHPLLVVSVLHSLGLVARDADLPTNPTFGASNLNAKNLALHSECFKQILDRVKEKHSTSLIDDLQSEEPTSNLKRSANPSDESAERKKPRLDEPVLGSIPTESIRGGGEVLADTVDEQARPGKADPAETSNGPTAKDDSKGPSKNAVAQVPSSGSAAQTATSTDKQSSESSARLGARVPEGNKQNAAGPFQAPNQAGRVQNPATGDLTNYLGGMSDRLYDMQQMAQGQLPSFAFPPPNPSLIGYSFQERTASAQALLAREHQAAALLGSYGHGGFQQTGTNSTSMPAIMGAPPIQTGTNSTSIPTIMGTSPIPTLTRVPMSSDQNGTQDRGNGSAYVAPDPRQSSVMTHQGKLLPQPRTGADRNVLAEEKPTPLNDESIQTSEGRIASELEAGRFHLLSDSLSGKSVGVLLAAAAEVPIPRGLVIAPLKERLNTPGFKNAGKSGAPPIDKGVVTAAILAWLWNTHAPSFRRAFETNGRYDVDSDCKWLIQAAVDTAVSELSLEIANSIASGKGAFADVSQIRPSPANQTKVDFCTAAIVSRSLASKLGINRELNRSTPNQDLHINLLDEARLGALRAKSRERVLLANLLIRSTMITENFSNAYVSAIVRAGEAIGHEKLFEIVHDEEAVVSTLISNDIFSDDYGIWEDSCRPETGFTESLSGDELLRRAHARAAIQRSLRKLQDRYQIRGGTPNFGPFIDNPSQNAGTTPAVPGGDDRGSSSPRGVKRRASSMTEPTALPGTGSSEARGPSDYEPKHISFPVEWDSANQGNGPYGIHLKNRPLAIASVRPVAAANDPASVPNILKAHGTLEISWSQVASTFQSVELPRKSTKQRTHSLHSHDDATIPASGSIVAPSCKAIGEDSILESDEESDETVEDISDATVLTNHQEVLDEMKGKLAAYLEERKHYQDKRKDRHSK